MIVPRALSPRERRLVAVLFLVVAVALAWLALIRPILDAFAERAARRDALLMRYQHDLRTVASIPRLRRQVERQRGAVAGIALPARGTEAGREWLKERLEHGVERAGGELRESGDAEARPGWVRARVAARLTLPQLAALLARLQDGVPPLVVETLSVGADEALVTGRSSSLDVDLEASLPLRPAAAR